MREVPDYLPNMNIVYWPWTKPDDSRMSITGKYIIIKQDPEISDWFKIGMPNSEGWAAYINGGTMFVKTYKEDHTQKYPDFGSSYETFTNDLMLEMEILSPLKNIEPGGFVEVEEKWFLYDQIAVPKNAEEIDQNIIPLINKLSR
jgi:hypothetical protein